MPNTICHNLQKCGKISSNGKTYLIIHIPVNQDLSEMWRRNHKSSTMKITIFKCIFQYLLESGWAAKGHLIGVTQPRRVAAVTVGLL
jgi:hypothetical protein